MLTVVLGYESHSRDAEPQFIYAGHKKSEAYDRMDEAPAEILRFDVIEAPTVRRKMNKNAPKREEEIAAEKAAAEEQARVQARVQAAAKKAAGELAAARELVAEADAEAEAKADAEAKAEAKAKAEADAEAEDPVPKKKSAAKKLK